MLTEYNLCKCCVRTSLASPKVDNDEVDEDFFEEVVQANTLYSKYFSPENVDLCCDIHQVFHPINYRLFPIEDVDKLFVSTVNTEKENELLKQVFLEVYDIV